MEDFRIVGNIFFCKKMIEQFKVSLSLGKKIMNVEVLARLQFALTIMFHYIYPPLSIGLGIILVIAEGIYLKPKIHFICRWQNSGPKCLR